MDNKINKTKFEEKKPIKSSSFQMFKIKCSPTIKTFSIEIT